ncbi:diaminopimelate decarboxylase [Lysobacter niastensis]|uniref:Diaminopimelate decarboxylase n=1 Tax=Lysobacter niastensis TaxID=380629 RepID=A0ABS0B7M5_9GAMM|nr:diaminopimelate decarboxylase [Lysobacter niastensis]MBF6025016.1 diaminopimelate decarboxylase [Lysobacter niastensis]
MTVSHHFFDGVDLQALAAQMPTPFYAYSASAIRQRIAALQDTLEGLDARICYAVKANSNTAVLQLMARHGVGADIVSAGELRRSLRAGIEASRIVFSGVGKTEAEIVEALQAGVWKFNVESRDELFLLQQVAGRLGVTAHAAVRINPDVDAGTHEKISTGKQENKFGVSIEEAREWFSLREALPDVRLNGLHAHIGSQILSLEPFRRAMQCMADFARELAAAGHRLRTIDVGGGLGVTYRTGHDRPIAVESYGAVLKEVFTDFPGTLILEPGRWLVAEAGVLLTRAIRVKAAANRTFLVVDAAMNDLLRPAMYEAWHEIVPLHGKQMREVRYDVVGPVCESSDTFGVDRLMPECEAGDLLMITNAGAYGASMSSTYNSRPLTPEVLLDRGRHAVIRRRQTFEEMIAGECMAEAWETA